MSFSFEKLKPLDRLSLGRAALKEFLPFLHPVCTKFAFVENNAIPTCAVDNEGNFKYNYAFIMSLKDIDEAVNVLAHEAMHIVQQYHKRTPTLYGMNPHDVNKLFNLAADRVLSASLWFEHPVFRNNRIITEVLGISEELIYEIPIKYPYTESMFEELLKAYRKGKQKRQSQGQSQEQGQGQDQGQDQGQEQGQGQDQGQEQGQGQDQGQGQSDHDNQLLNNVRDGLDDGPLKDSLGKDSPCNAHQNIGDPSNSLDDSDGLDHWHCVIQLGKELQKQRGTLSSIILNNMVESLFKVKIPWSTYLLNYLDRIFGQVDFNYFKRARRGLNNKIILPATNRPFGKVAVAIDMSGSMDQEQRVAALTETKAICESYTSGVYVMLHTTDVYHAGYLNEADDVRKLPWASGGTSHKEVFKILKGDHEKFKIEDRDDVQLVICFTDMDTDFPEKAPNIPVIWVDTTGINDKKQHRLGWL